MRFVRSFGVVLAAAALALTPACKAAPVTTSPWPIADAERAVPRPPVPPVWPLTGLEAPSDAAIHTRVVSVKIENSPDAKPQSGLRSADVVYESLAEGGITRFNAIFHSNSPASAGPVRSARLSDIYIVPQYGAMFVFSGASGVVTARVRSAGLQNLSEDAGVTGCYTRVKSRKAPHNLYVDVAKARQVGISKGWKDTQDVRPFAFAKRAKDATGPATLSIGIPFSTSARADWTYDPHANIYLRSDRGRPHLDADGARLDARNVVVLWAKTHETGNTDIAGSPTLDITLGGTGRATLFRDGMRFDCMWFAQNGQPPVLKTDSGELVKLRPGRTWFEVIPTSSNITFK